jgi:multiple sugar transport system ATP-binding protein
MASITLTNVQKAFERNTPIIRNVHLEVGENEFCVFLGPSGCGKSTLLRMVAGLESITDGELRIDGRLMNNVPPAQRRVAMVFQNYALYPHMSVYENMAFGLRQAKMDKATIDSKVRRTAATLQLDTLLERRPAALSGGQRQRVAIGRAIVREPKAFLFDEPLSNLDAALRVQMRLEIGDLHQSLKTTMIYVTHDQVEAMTMADKIVVLNKGEVAQIGSPLVLYNHPQNLFVARFIGSPTMNIATGPSAAKRSATTIGIRPEHVDVSATAGEWPAKVRLAEHLGSDTYVHVEVDNIGPMTIRLGGEAPNQPGQRIFLTPQEPRIHRFDQQGLRIGQ